MKLVLFFKNICTSQLKLKIEQLKIEQTQSLSNLQLAVSENFENITTLKSKIGLVKKLDSLAQLRFQIVSKSYELGKALFIELEQAKTELITYKNQYMSLVRSYYLSYYSLKKLCNCELK